MFSQSGTRRRADAPRSQRLRAHVPRVLSRCLGITLAALLALPIAEVTQPAQAGKKNKNSPRSLAARRVAA